MKNLQRPSTDAEVEDGTLFFFAELKKNEIVLLEFWHFVERGAVATAINTSFTRILAVLLALA